MALMLQPRGLVFHDIIGVKTHDDNASWEITICRDGQERLVDVFYKTDIFFDVFGDEDLDTPGYKLAFVSGPAVLITKQLWKGQAHEWSTRLYLYMNEPKVTDIKGG